MEKNMDLVSQTADRIRSLPRSKLSSYLVNLLEQEMFFADKICKQAIAAHCSQGGTAADEARALTELVNLNERRCLHYRETADHMSRAINTDVIPANAGIPMPTGVDFSNDIEFSYEEKTNTLRVKMPVLLPLKPKWNSYIPDKVRNAIEQFDMRYRERTGKRIYFPHALVVLVHHYDDEKRARSHYRDYDNQEWSWTLNALHSKGMFNDSAATMLVMQMAVPDIKSFTEVVITDAERILATITDICPDIDVSIYRREGDSY